VITKIVYHAPDNATGLLTACPCCGESLLLDMRFLAPASPPPTLPEDGPAAVDGLTQPSAAAASGPVNDCCECHWWHRACEYSVIGKCDHPKIGPMQTVARAGGCVGHFLQRWNDGTDD